jgi:hypothetical protein
VVTRKKKWLGDVVAHEDVVAQKIWWLIKINWLIVMLCLGRYGAHGDVVAHKHVVAREISGDMVVIEK